MLKSDAVIPYTHGLVQWTCFDVMSVEYTKKEKRKKEEAQPAQPSLASQQPTTTTHEIWFPVASYFEFQTVATC